MEENKELLLQVLKEVKELREMVDKLNNSKTESTQTDTLKKSKTYIKNVENIKELQNSLDFSTKAYKFITSILSNNYTTLTFRQYAAVKSIAEQEGFTKPILK